MGSKIDSTCLITLCCNCCTYFNWFGSRLLMPLARSLSFSWFDSRLPAWSTTVTFTGNSSGTLDATRCTMALTCSWSRPRPGCRFSSTDAVGFCCSRTKTDGFGRARWTLAVSTADTDSIDFASSPSSARWKLTCSRNCDTPSFWFSISSKPTLPPLGKPCAASFRRASWTCSDGTRMAPPPSENLCLMPSWSSDAVMAPPSRSV